MAGSRLWRWDEGPAPVAERLIAAFTQRGIADGRWQNEGPCRGATLLLRPVSSRPAPVDISFECETAPKIDPLGGSRKHLI